MPKPLKPFGYGSSILEKGQGLPFLIGHLLTLSYNEVDNISSPAQKLKIKRLALVEDAVKLFIWSV